MFKLSLTQVRDLVGGRKLQFYCPSCSCPQYWQPTEQLERDQAAALQAAIPKNILVVDDDDLTSKLLKKVLESFEARIEVANNGKDALTKLAAENFDLMICDIRMPEMTGEELFNHVQRDALLPPQRIIFLTGDKSSAVRQFLDKSGCYYLYKPIQFLEFSEQVQEVLSGQVPI